MLSEPQERYMKPKRPNDPAKTRDRGDSKIPPDEIPKSEDELLESETERQERESNAAFDRSVGRLPPD